MTNDAFTIDMLNDALRVAEIILEDEAYLVIPPRFYRQLQIAHFVGPAKASQRRSTWRSIGTKRQYRRARGRAMQSQ